MQLRFVKTLPSFVRPRQFFRHRVKSLLDLSCFSACLGHQRMIIRRFANSPRGPLSDQSLSDLLNSLLALPLPDQQPSAQNRSRRDPSWKPMLGPKCQAFLCPFLSGLSFPPLVMNPSGQNRAKAKLNG